MRHRLTSTILLGIALGCVGLLAVAQADEDGSKKDKPKRKPPLIMKKAPKGFESEPAFEDDFDDEWKPGERGWRVATWKQNGTQMSPERCRAMKGYLVQTVLAGEPYRGGSIQSANEYGYGRWVARLKPSAVPGVLNSMFTDDWDDMTTPDADGDGTHFEIDIELLTYTFGNGRGKVHLAVHGHDLGKFVEDVPLDFDPSQAFHEWGIDIGPRGVAWHVDGKVIRTWTPDDGKKIPPIKHEMFFNSWTQEKWIKGPAKKDAHYAIDWVRFYPMKTKDD